MQRICDFLEDKYNSIHNIILIKKICIISHTKGIENPMPFVLEKYERIYYLISKISSPAVIAPALRWLNSE